MFASQWKNKTVQENSQKVLFGGLGNTQEPQNCSMIYWKMSL